MHRNNWVYAVLAVTAILGLLIAGDVALHDHMTLATVLAVVSFISFCPLLYLIYCAGYGKLKIKLFSFAWFMNVAVFFYVIIPHLYEKLAFAYKEGYMLYFVLMIFNLLALGVLALFPKE